MPSSESGVTYRDAGVDIDAKMRVVERVKTMMNGTLGSAAGPIGHFGGTWHMPSGPDQILVASADGVGTKLKLAFALGGSAHASVGTDIVNHCDNDILALGARGLFFLDYLATGKLDSTTVLTVIQGIADACEMTGLALIGGETAEMPDMYADGEYDLAGFIVGTVSPDRKVDGATVQQGDVILGLPSNGLHTNGYSLARRILGLTGEQQHDREVLSAPLPGGKGMNLGDALMQPHLSYRKLVQPVLDAGLARGMAHVTGGGLRDNVPRFLPDTCIARFDITSWRIPAIFDYLTEKGQVGLDEQYRAFNMGLGFVVVVPKAHQAQAQSLMPGSRVVGEILDRQTSAESAVQGLSCD